MAAHTKTGNTPYFFSYFNKPIFIYFTRNLCICTELKHAHLYSSIQMEKCDLRTMFSRHFHNVWMLETESLYLLTHSLK